MEPVVPPTMRELAMALNVSVSTVSLALRNDQRVAWKTRQRVQALARQKHYQLNPAVTDLMSHVRAAGRARYRETLGWLNLWETPDQFIRTGFDYQRLLWRGACRRADELGYTVDSFWLAESGMTARRMSEILTARGIRGLLIPPLPRSSGHLSLRWNDFSVVSLTHTVVRPRLHRVVPDHHANMQAILRTAKRRGYRRPGLSISRAYDQRGENRYRAAFYFFQQSLPRRDRIPMRLGQPTDTAADCIPWLKKHRPDVVITVGSQRHLRTLDLGDRDYAKNLGVVLLGYAQTDAGFNAMEENPLAIGACAVDHLAASLGRNERGLPSCPQTVLIPGTWVEGDTLTG